MISKVVSALRTRGPSRRRRAGVTLVELLVVTALIGILVALLLPAIQFVRGTARRMQCSGQLRQIGLGLQAYHESHGTFPPGGISLAPCCRGPTYTTWTIAILPYVEQQGLYDQYRQDRPNEHPANRQVVETFVPLYLCPSDVKTEDLERPEHGPGKRSHWTPGSYRAVSGATTANNGDWYFDNPSLPPQMPRSLRGALHVVRPRIGLRTERVGGITDGTSMTVLVGEYHTRSMNRRRTLWAYSYNSFNQSSVQKQRRTLVPDYHQCRRMHGHGGDNPCKRGFGSLHGGGMNALLADGSARFLAVDDIDLDVWWAMGTIAAADTVGDF